MYADGKVFYTQSGLWGTSAGATCPVRKAYVPEHDTGLLGIGWPLLSTFPNYIGNGSYDDANPLRLNVSQPSDPYVVCCPR